MTLSIRALEDKSVAKVRAKVRAATSDMTDYVASIVAKFPDKSASEILSRPDVQKKIAAAFATSSALIEASVRVVDIASRVTGRSEAQKSLRGLGESVDLPDFSPQSSDPVLEAVLERAKSSVSESTEDVGRAVREAHASVSEDSRLNPRTISLLRSAAVRASLQRSVRKLELRSELAVRFMSRRSFSEGRLAVYRQYSIQRPELGLMKRWRTTSRYPCLICADLNGQTIGLEDHFHSGASTAEGVRPPKVFFDLLTPPRHPYCQCEIDLVLSPASEEIIAEEKISPPVRSVFLSSEQIRSLPETKYQSLVDFFRSALSKLRILRRSVRRGD